MQHHRKALYKYTRYFCSLCEVTRASLQALAYKGFNVCMPRAREPRTLTIGQAAEALAVTPSWLRFGERLGALPMARRTPDGHRFYTPEDLDRLRRLGVGQRKRRLQERNRDG